MNDYGELVTRLLDVANAVAQGDKQVPVEVAQIKAITFLAAGLFAIADAIQKSGGKP